MGRAAFGVKLRYDMNDNKSIHVLTEEQCAYAHAWGSLFRHYMTKHQISVERTVLPGKLTVHLLYKVTLRHLNIYCCI
jgi:hypothetical protein